MDAAVAIELACNVSQFIDSASKSLTVLQAPAESAGTGNYESVNDLVKAVLEHAGHVQFSPPDGVALLSEEDEILIRLANQCKLLSSELAASLRQLDSRKGRETAIATEILKNNAELTQVLQAIREDLNDNLATRQWSSIAHAVRELGAKNSRLHANRTTEIEQLSSSIDVYFQAIKSRNLGDSESLAIWLNLCTAVQNITDYSAEQVILTALQFWTMDRRKELISKEHENTFEWIFAQAPAKDTSQPASNFAEWLGKDEPLYWISGKPGSGKSTLMKYVAESPKSMDRLKLWAGDNELITASFYFWSSAKDPLQKSDTGLLRSILFQILRQCPDLIRHAYPEQWKDRQSQGSMQRFTRVEPSISDLLVAYRGMSALMSTTKVNFCFFIDGLDEYDGEPTDVIRLIESLSKTDNLKTCISSRQWTEFETIFGGDNPWKLYIHELAKGDMQLYVKDLFGNNEKFDKLRATSDESAVHALITTIVENAEGVFLWVLLVVRALLDGLADTDKISHLQHKLAAIPNDLDEYFDKMFLDIELHMREQTAAVFVTTLNAAEKLPLICYWFMQEETLEGVKGMAMRSLSREAATERLREMALRLDIYSQGLLKVNNTINGALPSSELGEHQWLFEFRVDFLHRTVADFLRTAQMTKLLSKWSAQTFDVDFEICKACLALIKVTPPTTIMFQEASRVRSILHLVISHAKLLERSSPVDVLDELLSSLTSHSDSLPGVQTMILGVGNYWAYDSTFNFAMLYHFVSYGLGEYVELQLDRGKLQFTEPTSGLLSGCFSWDPRVRMGTITLSVDTIERLLKRGLDPNLPWGDRGSSFWQQLLTTTYSRHLKGIVAQADCDAIRLAVEHGANLKAPVEVFASRRLGNTTAADIVEKVLPKQQFLVLGLSGPK